MKKRLLRFAALLCALALLFLAPASAAAKSIKVYEEDWPVEPDGWYDTMEEVAVYLALYDELPDNYLTKREAQALGWNNRLGNLDEVAPGCSIGGDRFGNYEGTLPAKKGRTWIECDINYTGGYRGAERIAFSSDGLIYYSDDHYDTFTQVKVIPDTQSKKH